MDNVDGCQAFTVLASYRHIVLEEAQMVYLSVLTTACFSPQTLGDAFLFLRVLIVS